MMPRAILALAVLGLAVFANSTVQAADVVEVLPLTDRILLVHVDEGHVVHHKLGEPRANEPVIAVPLDVAKASRPESYALTSKDDAAYATARQPTEIGRKSKGTDFSWAIDWDAKNKGREPAKPDHAKEHWLYLTLPMPLTPGRTYALSTGSLARNGSTFTLTFDPASTRSEAVHVNLLGYAPRAPQKFAYAYAWMGDKGSLDLKPYAGKPFHLIDGATKTVAFTGKLSYRKSADNPETAYEKDTPKSNFLNADVFECDFSAFDTPGAYVLSIDGIGCSFPFKIDADTYRAAYRATSRGLYHNRSGIPLTKPYTDFERPAPGNPNLTPGFKGKLVYTTLRWPDYGGENPADKAALTATMKGPLDEAWGWYQDAGDWDGYYSHLRVAQELLIAYDLAPQNFHDGDNNIPESGNGLPDILDEAAWLPRFCYRLRHELITNKYGTGGIGLRVAPDLFGTDEGTRPDGTKVGQGSWQDTRTYAASGEDPWSTYRYAGVAAHLALLLDRAGLKDAGGVDWSREARESYAWSRANTRPGDETHKENLKVPRAYAAAALFRLTAEKAYEEQFLADTQDITPTSLVTDESRYAPVLYALTGAAADRAAPNPEAHKRITAALLATADADLQAADKRALRWAGNWWMPMLMGQQTTPLALELGVARKLTLKADPAKSLKYLAALYTTADYFLGTNAMNMTFITGVGPRHPVHPFHMDAWYNGKPTVHEGIVPYGQSRKEKDRGDGPWDAAWAYKTVYPDIDAWPGNERFFDNRCCPLTSEFTIHQTIGPSAAFYALLAAPGIE